MEQHQHAGNDAGRVRDGDCRDTSGWIRYHIHRQFSKLLVHDMVLQRSYLVRTSHVRPFEVVGFTKYVCMLNHIFSICRVCVTLLGCGYSSVHVFVVVLQ